MSRSTAPSPTFGLLVLALLLGLGGMVAFGVRSRAGASEAPGAGTVAEGSGGAALDLREAVVEPARCAQAGYLCSGLLERPEPRVLRWSDDTRAIRIGLPQPEGVEPDRARALQAAAAAGLLTWQGKPFTIEIERSGGGEAVDFTVRWSSRLEGAQLGRVDTRWFREADGRTGMQVQDFVLVHRDPFDRDRPLATRKVQLAAAHEMGHALGLPHSDSDRDVMFPTNTARSLSARDYATMAALYSLQNGALVTPP